MATEWLYSRDGTDHGPVSSSELVELAKNGQLLPSDLLWKEGMSEWKPASSFPKLFPSREENEVPVVIVTTTNKPTASKSGTAKAVANKVTSRKIAPGAQKAVGKKRMWMIVGGVLLGLIIVGGMVDEDSNKGSQRGSAKTVDGRTKSQKSWEWNHGAEKGREMVEQLENAIQRKDHPRIVEGLHAGIAKVANMHLEEVAKIRRLASNQKASEGRVSPDIAEALQRCEDLYNGYMSEAGRYVR